MSAESRSDAAFSYIFKAVFGLLSVYNIYYGYYSFHYGYMKELRVSTVRHPDFPKKVQEYLIRGRVECANPTHVSHFNSERVVYTQKSYCSRSDFSIDEGVHRIGVQVTPKSQFLAKRLSREISTQFSIWTWIEPLLCLLTETSGQYMEVGDVIPVGVDVCIAGRYLPTKPPAIEAHIVALSKRDLVLRYAFPLFIPLFVQIVWSAAAIWDWYKGRKRCPVCKDRNIDALLNPCNHKSCCYHCTGLIAQCPECKMKITGVVQSR